MSQKPTRVRYVVLGSMCLIAMLAYVHRGCLAVPARDIERDLALSRDEFGLATSMFLWGYTIMQLPGGLLGDRWGSRRVLPVLVLLSALATGLSGFSFNLGMLLVCRFVMGAAQAGMFPCAVLSFAKWFPTSQRAFPNGMLASFMSVGGAIATTLTGLMTHFYSWPIVFLLFAEPGLLIAFWFFVWFRDRPADHASVNAAELDFIRGDAALPQQPAEHSVGTPWVRIFTDSRMLWICGQQFFRAACYIFYTSYFPLFLQETRRVGVSESGYLASFPLLGVVFGSMAGGIITDWIYRRTGSQTLSRKGVALFALTASAAFMFTAYWIEDVGLTVLWLSLSTFCAGLCGPAGYTATIDLGGKHVGTVFSIMNMAGNFGAALFTLVCVRFEQFIKLWKIESLPATPGAASQVTGWNEVMLVLGVLYLCGALCWLLLNMKGKPLSEPA